MPIVKAQCTNCGGVLEVDNAKEAAICPFCNTPYIVEKAINNYSISNKFEIQNADIKIVGEDIEQMLANADTLLNVLKRNDEAKAIFKTVTQKKPDDYRGWWGLLKVATNNFTSINQYATQYETDLYNSALAVAPDTMKKLLINEYIAFDKRRQSVLSLQQDIYYSNNAYEKWGKVFKRYGIVLLIGTIAMLIAIVEKSSFFLVAGLVMLALSIFAIVSGILYRNSIKKRLQQLNSELKSINKV